MADPRPGAVPFTEAIDFFRQKIELPTETWTDLWQGMHARAFVVAGATQAQLISDFREAVDRAIAEGTTLADFRKDFDRIVETHGWSYRGSRGWRSRVIFETNLRTAYAAGKWQQAQRLKERRPFLRYVSVLDSRTRPEHAAWHGTVLPADHPWWSTHFPPNGWNCRCTVQQLSQRDLDRFGYTVSDEAPPVTMESRQVNTPGGPVSIQVPEGIDSGFGYNVGEAAWGRSQQRVLMERHGAWEPLTAPGGSRPGSLQPLPVDTPRTPQGPRVRPGDEAGLRQAFRNAIGGDARTLVDPAGARVRVTQAIPDHIMEKLGRWDGREAYFPFIPELVENPHEIWVGFARSEISGRFSVRRRYVKVLDIGKGNAAALVTDADEGFWSGFTFFNRRVGDVDALRRGLRIYKRP